MSAGDASKCSPTELHPQPACSFLRQVFTKVLSLALSSVGSSETLTLVILLLLPPPPGWEQRPALRKFLLVTVYEHKHYTLQHCSIGYCGGRQIHELQPGQQLNEWIRQGYFGQVSSGRSKKLTWQQIKHAMQRERTGKPRNVKLWSAFEGRQEIG